MLAVAAAWSIEPESVLAPREAFFARHVSVSAPEAIGRLSAELVAPYPPGVPVLAPGERLETWVAFTLHEGLDRVTSIERGDGGLIVR